jgi:uncharacterized zinc-type alcohol dehydrogenase-like protein
VPLLCRFYGGQANSKIGVAGLGGLGHMAVKFAVAMGAEVTVLSRSDSKRDEALRKLGAAHFVNTTDRAALGGLGGAFDLIIDTISADHDVDQLIDLVRCDGGNLCMVGLPPEKVKVSAGKFVGPRKLLSGSNIGGIAETQAMLNFCGRHAAAHRTRGIATAVATTFAIAIAEVPCSTPRAHRHAIVCEVEKIRADQINDAFERTVASDVRYRFVIDTATM